ncbi:MAG: penicillin-binding protein activator [Micavibrio sp.]
MTVFHRFYRVFPLFLITALLLTGCSGGQDLWRTGSAAPGAKDGQATGDTVYAALPSSDDAGGPAIKAAILLPLSGAHAALGQSMLQAAQLAVFDLGYENFELLPRDTAKGAGEAARSALHDGAQIILGPLFAEDVHSAKQATAGSNVNIIAFSTDWSLAGPNTYIMGFLPFGQVDRITRYAAANGLKRPAIAAAADAYGTATSSRFEEQARLNGLTISRVLSDVNGYDSVFIPAGGNALSGILQRVTNKNAQKLGTGLWDDARIAAMPEMNGAWFAAPSPAARRDFETRFQATYGTKPQRLGTLAYDATALVAALAKSGGFTAANITNPNGFAGVDGIVRFNNAGLAERGLAILEIRNGSIIERDPAPSSFVK